MWFNKFERNLSRLERFENAGPSSSRTWALPRNFTGSAQELYGLCTGKWSLLKVFRRVFGCPGSSEKQKDRLFIIFNCCLCRSVAIVVQSLRYENIFRGSSGSRTRTFVNTAGTAEQVDKAWHREDMDGVGPPESVRCARGAVECMRNRIFYRRSMEL